MRIDIITVLPEMIEGFFNCSIMKRAQNKGLAEIHIHNLRDYTEDKYRRVSVWRLCRNGHEDRADRAVYQRLEGRAGL